MLDYYETESPDYIGCGRDGYGDWLSLGTPTDKNVISTLYYARAVFIASKLCEIIGDYEAENYRNHYINIKKLNYLNISI